MHLEGLLYSGSLAVLANFDRRLCGGLRLRNHRAVAENYNFIKRFSDFTCLVAVFSCCIIVVCLETVKRLSMWSAFFFTYTWSWDPVPEGTINFQEMPGSWKCPC